MVAAATLRRHATVEASGHGVSIGALHPAYRTGRSIFPSRVFDPDEVQRVLKDGHQSRKIGKFVTKGKMRGFPIFTLTLEERATCPRTCLAWGECYGNAMHAAERIVAGPALETALWDELAALQQLHPGGFLVRLHVLGDFYSLDYAQLWHEALEAYPALHIFGYTARPPQSDIGQLKPLGYEGHDAAFPPDLIEPCILAGCPVGGTVLDPFGGAGTTGLVADRLQRDAILIELNPEYAEIARNRIASEAGMFGEVLAA
jgi:hypothetical protein